jgi:nitrite reductase (NADH) large subunit
VVIQAQDSRAAVSPSTDAARRSLVFTVAERVLGIDSTGERQLFPTYTDLALDAGVPTGRGVLVDNRMQTQIPNVFAAGDVAEHAGRVLGLWPTATEQARVAAVNALGGTAVVSTQMPAMILKDVGLDLFSIGRLDAKPNDQVIVVDRPAIPSYRRLVLFQDWVIGAVILGHHPAELASAQKAVRNGIRLSAAAQRALRSGDWSVLGDVVATS